MDMKFKGIQKELCMKKNREIIVNELLITTNYPKEKCEIIFSILASHGIIGRKNKEKIINDLIEKLNITQKEADTLYNICMKVMLKNKF